MRTEAQRAYDRARYAAMPEEKKKELSKIAAEWKREHRKDPAFRERENALSRARKHTEEYRAKRRAAYAAKHANDPMTPHRKACIEAMRKITRTPIEERRARKQELLARKQALKDIRDEQL